MLGEAIGLGALHTHIPPEQIEDGEFYVFLVRDPRDSFISYWEVYCQTATKGHLLSQEQFFHEKFVGKGQSQVHFRLGWKGHTERLLELRERYPHNTMLVHFEELKDYPSSELRWILDRFRLSAPDENIDKAIAETEGKRCDPSDLPVKGELGRVGRWRGVLEPGVEALLRDYCGDLMQRLGYVQ
jgi:hypothetical protein